MPFLFFSVPPPRRCRPEDCTPYVVEAFLRVAPGDAIVRTRVPVGGRVSMAVMRAQVCMMSAQRRYSIEEMAARLIGCGGFSGRKEAQEKTEYSTPILMDFRA